MSATAWVSSRMRSEMRKRTFPDISESKIPSRTKAPFGCQVELKVEVVQVHG